MKRVTACIFALSLMSGAATLAPAAAQPAGPPPGQECGRPGQPPCDPPRRERDRQPGDWRQQAPDDEPRLSPHGPRWSPGDRLPENYRQERYAVRDWRRNNLPAPPRGHRWLCYQGGHCFLVANDTGVIRRSYWRDDREDNWRRRYSRVYTYHDDIYYRECRERSDPAGILIGGLIGGLLGRGVGDGDPGATFAGIIIGAAAGAALTRDLDCDDRSYAYRSYHSALNSGRAGIVHRWRNPRNDHRGEFRVRSYYYDAGGFRCANYTNVVYLDRRRQVNGRACRQPNGAWAFLD
jgi:Ni/Co efflux regulator RcnB/surface antigen